MNKGLGDKIAQVTKATGIYKAVKAIVGEDCGCEERQKKLNAMFPNLKALMTPDQFSIYGRIKGRLRGAISAEDNETVRQLYNSVFNANEQPSTCGRCVKRRVEQLNKIYENQCNV